MTEPVMKSLLLEEYGKLAVAEVPQPVPGEHDVLVHVAACGICGSDVHGYDGSSGAESRRWSWDTRQPA